MKFTKKLLGKNQKGVAIMYVMFIVVLIMFMVTEISYETNVEYLVNAHSVNRLKAYYAARSGVELSLLRIKMYARVQEQLKGQDIGEFKKYVDMIWNFPFVWPPVIPSEVTRVDQEAIAETVKLSKMDASYRADIVDEGTKIDLNDLDSPSKTLKELSKKLILSIFENLMKNDEQWARTHQDLKYADIVNNIIDWVDKDENSLNSGDEKQYYAELKSENLPPNRPFRTLEELRMVAGMTDEVFLLLKDRVTIYGMRAINPNNASAEVLQSLDITMTPKVVAEIIKGRTDEKVHGPFKSDTDFWAFANQSGANVTAETQKEIPIITDSVYNFRVKSVGEFAGSTREIEVVVYDMANVATQIAENLKRDDPNANQDPNGGASGSTGSTPGSTDTSTGQNQQKKSNNNKEPLPKGPPRIVYWTER